MVTVRLTGLTEWTVLAVTRRQLRAAARPERGPEKDGAYSTPCVLAR